MLVQAVVEGRLVPGSPHARASLSVSGEEQFHRGSGHLSWLRGFAESDSRQPARRVPDAVLRFDEQPQPAILRGDFQSHESRRAIPDDGFLGDEHHDAQGPIVAASVDRG